MNTEIFFIALGSTILAAVLVTLVIASSRKAHSHLKRWAKIRGYELLRTRALGSPFAAPFLPSGGFDYSFKVTVLDGKGRERSGWVQFKHVFRGFSNEDIRVKWDLSHEETDI